MFLFLNTSVRMLSTSYNHKTLVKHINVPCLSDISPFPVQKKSLLRIHVCIPKHTYKTKSYKLRLLPAPWRRSLASSLRNHDGARDSLGRLSARFREWPARNETANANKHTRTQPIPGGGIANETLSWRSVTASMINDSCGRFESECVVPSLRLHRRPSAFPDRHHCVGDQTKLPAPRAHRRY